MEIWFWVGILASISTSIQFLPQVVKAFNTKRLDDLSAYSLGLIVTSCLLWLIYGLAINDIPILLANSVILLSAITLVILKIRYRKS